MGGGDIGMKLDLQQNTNYLKLLGKDVPLGGLPNNPDDVAHSLLYLGSSDAKIITGEVMVVDGGQSLTNDRFDDFTVQLRR